MELKSTVEDLDSVTKKITVVIPAETVSEKVEESLSHLAKSARVKGFRPGKAPRHIIEKLHGGRVRYEVANELISSSLTDLVRQHEIPMIGRPNIDVAAIEPGKELEYTANVSVYPRPAVTAYDKFDVSVPKRQITDEDVEKAIEHLRKGRTKTSPLQFRNTAERSDVIHALIELVVDGKSLGRPEPVDIGLDEGRLHPEVEAGLVGMEVGSVREISVKMPEHHSNKSLRGKEVLYRVNLNGLSEKVLPELNDDFAKEVDAEAPTVLALRMKLRTALEEQADSDARSAAQAKILDQLLAMNSFEVPQILIDDEIRNLLVRNGLLDASKVNVTELDVSPFRAEIGGIAEKRVKSAILVDRIGEEEKIEAGEEDFTKALAEMAEEHGLSEENVGRYFEDRSRRSGLMLEITRDRILEFLTDRATISYTAPESEARDEADAGADAAAGAGA